MRSRDLPASWASCGGSVRRQARHLTHRTTRPERRPSDPRQHVGNAVSEVFHRAGVVDGFFDERFLRVLCTSIFRCLRWRAYDKENLSVRKAVAAAMVSSAIGVMIARPPVRTKVILCRKNATPDLWTNNKILQRRTNPQYWKGGGFEPNQFFERCHISCKSLQIGDEPL